MTRTPEKTSQSPGDRPLADFFDKFSQGKQSSARFSPRDVAEIIREDREAR